jgi:hypothetical protein
MDKPSILIQLDTDTHPSVFDRVVAVDSGVQHLFSYGGVTPDAVMPLVHGCIFTRGPKDLAKTAIFIGGSDVTAGETLLAEVRKHLLPMFGLSVSVMLDSNGANTTAVAAVIAAGRHVDLKTVKSLVLGGTGPVGQRVARLLAAAGGHVRIGSRSKDKAEVVAAAIRKAVPTANVEAVASSSSADAPAALDGRELVVAAGAPGAMMMPQKYRTACKSLMVAIDLNGVPPAGIEGVELNDKAVNRQDCICYGALGVGGTKMKVHKAAITALFTKNDQVFDIDQIYQLGKSLGL